MILHTDLTDFTELHGESIKKSVFIRVIRVQNVLTTAIPNEPSCFPAIRNMNHVLARRRSLDPLGCISILYAKSGMMSITKLVDRSPACVGIFINNFTALIFKNTANLPDLQARVIRRTRPSQSQNSSANSR